MLSLILFDAQIVSVGNNTKTSLGIDLIKKSTKVNENLKQLTRSTPNNKIIDNRKQRLR